MTQALYDLIGADRTADHASLRAAYSRTVAQLVRRRKALVEQGGDTRTLDLARAQADEAWSVLRDPARRRRYDALLALSEHGDLPRGQALWSQVVGSLSSPASASAVDVVRALTHLDVGQVAAPASHAPDVPTAVDAARPAPVDTQADVPTLADTRRARDMPALRVVPGARPQPKPVADRAPNVVPFQERPGAPSPVFAVPSGAMTGAGAQPPDPSPAGAPVVRLTPPPQVVPEPVPTPVPLERSGSRPLDPGGPRSAHAIPVDALVAEHGWSGALLRAVREARGMSVRDIGSATRISARYLDAIERDDHAALPSATFVKGYLREIARTLQLDEAALVQGYMRRMG